MSQEEQRNDNPPKRAEIPADAKTAQKFAPLQADVSKAQKRAGLGKRGETVAAQWLEARGYRILAQNWRFGRLELDLVAKFGRTLVIVEVKTRRESGNDSMSRPEEAVNPVKQHRLGQAGRAFLASRSDCLDLRFDVIAIRVRDNRCRLYHQQDAFFPGA